jgi:hypothetical protein
MVPMHPSIEDGARRNWSELIVLQISALAFASVQLNASGVVFTDKGGNPRVAFVGTLNTTVNRTLKVIQCAQTYVFAPIP